jgi:hypothetical protein
MRPVAPKGWRVRASSLCRWAGDDLELALFSAGRSLSGWFRLREREIEVDVELPWALRPFAAPMMNKTEEGLRAWIERAQRGELGQQRGTA